jgi:hypothetical protein
MVSMISPIFQTTSELLKSPTAWNQASISWALFFSIVGNEPSWRFRQGVRFGELERGKAAWRIVGILKLMFEAKDYFPEIV